MNETQRIDLVKTQGTRWALKLFVAPNSAASATAILQARRIIAEYLPTGSTLEIVDVFGETDTAVREQVLAVPTLVRMKPEPVRRIIGDLSDAQKVLTMLGITAE